MRSVPLLLLLPLLLLFVAIVRLVGPVVRWTFRIGVALAAALFAAAVLPPSDTVWVPLLIFLVVLVLASRREQGREPRRPGRRRGAAPLIANPSAAAPSSSWRELRALAGWGRSRRLDAAREACERYLQLAETQEDPSAQLPIRLRRHLPALVDDCVRHCRTATRDEQRALVAQTLTSVERIAAQAEARRRELAHQAQSEFRARQAHLAREGD